MREPILVGSVEQSIDVFLLDNAQADGRGKTGVAFDDADLTCYYRLGATGAVTQLPLVTLADCEAAWDEGGFVEIDAANMRGMYRLDLPDAMFADEWDVSISIMGADFSDTPIVIPVRSMPARHLLKSGGNLIPIS